MNILIVGASKGLGKAFVEGLACDDDTIIGISRRKPDDLQMQSKANVEWIEADMANSIDATNTVEAQSPAELDVIILFQCTM